MKTRSTNEKEDVRYDHALKCLVFQGHDILAPGGRHRQRQRWLATDDLIL